MQFLAFMAHGPSDRSLQKPLGSAANWSDAAPGLLRKKAF
jgi:hypothetical protein